MKTFIPSLFTLVLTARLMFFVFILNMAANMSVLAQTPSMTATDGIIYVKEGGAGLSDGSSWDNAYPNLADPLILAAKQQIGVSVLPGFSRIREIRVAEGTYYPMYMADGFDLRRGSPNVPEINGGRDNAFVLVPNVRIIGGFVPGDLIEPEALPAFGSTGRNGETILSGDVGISGNRDDYVYHVVIGVGKNVDENIIDIDDDVYIDENTILDGVVIADGNANGGGTISVNGDIETYRNEGGGILLYYASPTLANVTIRGNHADAYGGGMYNWLSSPTLNNVTVENNTTNGEGGGIHNDNRSFAKMNNVIIRNNSASFGGGIFNDDNSSPTLNNVTVILNNASQNGAGIFNRNSSPLLNNVTIEENIAVQNGGGMYNINSSTVLTDITIDKNEALNGGGIYNDASTPMLTNVNIRGNSASQNGGGVNNVNSSHLLTNVIISGNSATLGGGINNINSSTVLTNVTISGNTATANGGGMSNDNSSPEIRNSIIWGNGASNVHNIGGGVPVYAYSLTEGVTGGVNGNISGDPQFVNWIDPASATMPNTDGDYRLQITSPAINNGDNTFFDAPNTPDLSFITTDVEGKLRISEGVIDMGGYELYFRPYDYLAMQCSSAGPGGDVIKLQHDVIGIEKGDYELFIGRSLTLDLNGYTLEIEIPVGNNDDNGIKIDDGAVLTITDSRGGGLLSAINKSVSPSSGCGSAINTSEGSLIINDASVFVQGALNCAAIGGGLNQSGGSISVSASSVSDISVLTAIAGNNVVNAIDGQVTLNGSYRYWYNIYNTNPGGDPAYVSFNNETIDMTLSGLRFIKLMKEDYTVVVTKDNSTITAYRTLDLALAGITSDGVFDIKIYANQTISPYTITSGRNVSLSSGYDGVMFTVTNRAPATGSMFTVNGNATFTLYDDITFRVISNGATQLNRPFIIIDGGQFDMHGGLLTGNEARNPVGNHRAGGVSIINGGVFNMYGGTISHNSYETAGIVGGAGGVLVFNSTFNMYGGTISHNINSVTNTSIGNGAAAVYVSDGTFYMYGGIICDNKQIGAMPRTAGGVYLANISKFYMSGGMLERNSANGDEYNANGVYSNSTSLIYFSGAPIIRDGVYVMGNLADRLRVSGNFTTRDAVIVIKGASNTSPLQMVPSRNVTGTLSGLNEYPTARAFISEDRTLIGTVSGNRVIWTDYFPIPTPDENGAVYVTMEGEGNHTGVSWNHAYPGLADPLRYAALQWSENSLYAFPDTDTIRVVYVAEGIYKPQHTSFDYDFDAGDIPKDAGSSLDQRDRAFVLVNGIKIYGGFIVDDICQGTGHCITTQIPEFGTLGRTGKTVLSGDIDDDGTLDNNSYHVVIAAGGINAAISDTTALDGVTISGGNANGSGNITVNKRSISKSFGGGIYNFDASPVLKHVTITENSASDGGGGIYNESPASSTAAPTLVNVVVSGNSADNGGGIMQGGCVNCSEITIINSTISGNSATRGGGIELFSGALNVFNSIIYGNTASNNANVFANSPDATYNFSNSIVGAFTAPGVSDVDPLFEDATLGDYRLQINSPAINAGDNTLIPTDVITDLDGNPRLSGSFIDMGAYEFQLVDDNLDFLNLAPYVFTYNGTPQTPEAEAASGRLGIDYLYKMQGEDDTHYSSVTPVNAGDYTVRALLPVSGGYNETMKEVDYTIQKIILTPSIDFTDVTGKEYDGATDIIGNQPAITLSGKSVAGELPTASALFAFVDANAGTNKSVNATFIELTIGWDTNYELSKTELLAISSNLEITPRTLTITGVTAQDREYNGTTTVVLTGGDLQNVVIADKDDVNFILDDGAIDDPNVGDNKSVTTKIALVLTGTAIGNYTLTQPADVTVNITKTASPGSTETVLIFKENATIHSADVNLFDLLPDVIANDGVLSYTTTITDVSAIIASPANSETVTSPMTVTVNTTAQNGQTATVSVIVESTNYAIFTIDVQIIIVAKDVVSDKITFPSGSAVYNRQKQPYEKATIDGFDDNEIEYSYSSITGTLSTDGFPFGAGIYSVTASYEDDDFIGVATAIFTITQLELTFDLIVNSREYDGTNNATTAPILALNGIITPDDVNLVEGIAYFVDKNVGINKEIILTGYELAGADIDNYTLKLPTDPRADITQRTLDFSFATISKTYDGNGIATAGSITFDFALANSELQSGIDYHVNAVFTDASNEFNAGINKSYSYLVTMMSTSSANNYKLLESSKNGVNGVINKAPAPGNNFETNLTFKTGETAPRYVDLDNIIPDVTGNYGTIAYTASINDFYNIISSPANGATVASPMPVIISPTANDNETATIQITVESTNYEDFFINVQVIIVAKDVVSDNIIFPNGSAVYNRQAQPYEEATIPGFYKSAIEYTYTPVTGTLSPDGFPFRAGIYSVTAKYEDEDYIGAATALFTITPLDITIADIFAENKTYDGNISAELSGLITLDGVIAPDDVSLVEGVAYFVDKNVGVNKEIILTGFSLEGADANNYTLILPTNVTADITKKELTVSIDFSGTVGKEYDGTTAIIGAQPVISLSGIVGNEIPTTTAIFAFVDANAGTNKGVDATSIELTNGWDANYELSVSELFNFPSPLEIAKATPPYIIPTGLTANYGDLLSTVELPDGWTWETSTALVGDVGIQTHLAKFTPADIINYNIVENIPVDVTVIDSGLSNDNDIYDLIVNGLHTVRNGNHFGISLECGFNAIIVEVIVHPQATVTINGVVGAVYTLNSPAGGDNYFAITVVAPNGDSEDYTLTVNFPVPFEQIVVMRWNNRLTIIDNPLNNGGYEFNSYQWYRNDTPISTEQSLTAGANGEELNETDIYYVEVTADNINGVMRTCKSSVKLRNINIKAFPNPVASGQTLWIEADMDDDLLDGAIIEVYNISGMRVDYFNVQGRFTPFEMKYSGEVLIFVFCGKDGFRKELKVVNNQ